MTHTFAFIGRTAGALALAVCGWTCLSVQAQPAVPPVYDRFDVPATDEGLPGAGPISRFEWFRNTWRARRSGWVARVPTDQQALVFLGDSITHGWGDNLGGHFPETKLANRGIGGDTSRGVLIRLQEDVLSLHPRGVVLLIGTNDIEQGAQPETVAANVRLILAELRRQDPKMPIVLCTVFPSSASTKRPAQKIQQVNLLLGQVAREHAQVTLLDTWSLFANAAGDATPQEFPDLLHPNAGAYAKWADALRPVLSKLGLLNAKAVAG